ncbi:hypothetical protein [Legionella maioricensis]|uniref:Uncharacterized protein n=1 Tax=Legionella maioricensis TaxID=2896528 RepID=A0A9X2IDU0_9GAMM|nr:hypothetical protein [Legionella maioricensis]MCL9685133.1 hypothetical protein [Legionella maioricensis]MCL9688354.1 hypothetical protein [Legionella maioricensis]
MKQYIWFHPLYISETPEPVIIGQMNNAKKHNYIILQEKELEQVGATDHLTITGHSTSPKPNEGDDQGLYIQGETAEQCVARLVTSGLSFAPKILSIESCKAAVDDGIARKLSLHPFFKNSLIEANPGGIGRNPGYLSWNGMTVDSFGRVVLREKINPWLFLLRGTVVAERRHASYKLQDIIQTIMPPDFHELFFSYYNSGIFGGRVGRYCFFTGNKITLERALILANEKPESSTAKALDSLSERISLD